MATQKERPFDLMTATVGEIAELFAQSFSDALEVSVRRIVRDELRRQASRSADSQVAS